MNIVVIGGGIAGMSVAARLAEINNVVLLERESQPGYHSSGRSAAVYIEPYINETIFRLTRDSKQHHLNDGAKPLKDYQVAVAEIADDIDPYLSKWKDFCPDICEVGIADLAHDVPIIRTDKIARVVYDPQVLSIDTNALLEGFRRAFINGGGEVMNNSEVLGLTRSQGSWLVETAKQSFPADIVVNAAGAWGDEVAQSAGIAPLGLTPKRRSALLLNVGQSVSEWPMVHSIDNTLYFKPEAGSLMVSPANQDPTPPCDAMPEELDIAIAMARFEEMTHCVGLRPENPWAGLRTFLPDLTPSIGFDDKEDGFFWLVGQGGFGMQTAPAISQLAADMINERPHTPLPGVAPGRKYSLIEH